MNGWAHLNIPIGHRTKEKKREKKKRDVVCLRFWTTNVFVTLFDTDTKLSSQDMTSTKPESIKLLGSLSSSSKKRSDCCAVPSTSWSFHFRSGSNVRIRHGCQRDSNPPLPMTFRVRRKGRQVSLWTRSKSWKNAPKPIQWRHIARLVVCNPSLSAVC